MVPPPDEFSTVDGEGVDAAMTIATDPHPRRLSRKEARELIDDRAQRFLGISGADFVERYDRGELDTHDDNVMRVAMLLPLGR
jgi:hypothetical protein